MSRLPINLACETCKFFRKDYLGYHCKFCIPCDRYGICQICCVNCNRSFMRNNKPRCYKTYYEITSFIEEYLYRHDRIAFTLCIIIPFVVFIIGISVITIAEILLGIN